MVLVQEKNDKWLMSAPRACSLFRWTLRPEDEVSVSPDDRGFLLATGSMKLRLRTTESLSRSPAHGNSVWRKSSRARIDDSVADPLEDVFTGLSSGTVLRNRESNGVSAVTRGVRRGRTRFPRFREPTVYAYAAPFFGMGGSLPEWCITRLICAGRDSHQESLLMANVLANRRRRNPLIFEAILIRERPFSREHTRAFLA